MVTLPMIVIHVGETVMLDQTRLWKYGVQRGSSLWWKWIGSTMVEGFGAFARIDATVKREEEEAAKQKH